MAELRLLSTMGVMGLLRGLAPEWVRANRIKLTAEFKPTQILMQRIEAGERSDVAILTAEAVDRLVASGVLLGRTDLARSHVGIAVRAGTRHPAIGTREAVVATLLGARSIAMSEAGASGIFFAGLLERLGIAETVRAKATVIPAGFTAELVANGEAEIAVQQISELMAVPGVEVVGRLPPEIEGVTLFAAGVFAGAAEPAAAAALIEALADPARAGMYRQSGLDPVAPDRA